MKRAISRRAASSVPRRAAAALQRHAHQPVGARRIRTQIMIDLVDFAAQAEDDRRRNVRMHQHAAQRAPQLIDIGADGVSAAFAVRKGHNAIDIRRQRLRPHSSRDRFRRMRRAVAGRHHRDVVPRAHAAVLARVAREKCGHGASGSGIRNSPWREIRSRGSTPRTRDCACGCAARHRSGPWRARSPGRSATPFRPAAMARSATLCPAGMASRSQHRQGRRCAVRLPAGSGTRAIATLSEGCRWMAEFSAVGSFGDFEQHLGPYLSRFNSPSGHFGVDVQTAAGGMDPEAVAFVRDAEYRPARRPR